MQVGNRNTNYSLYDKTVSVPLGDEELGGRLTVPNGATHIVIFAHGSGSSRFSPRNWFVAEILHSKNIATLLTDLFSEREGIEDQRTGQLRFDIPLLAERLEHVTRWAAENEDTKDLQVCYFGSSTGAAAALIAAAENPDDINAIVSRGGRPDLAGNYLQKVTAPVLLIVGERDRQVLALNEQALHKLNALSSIHIVPGATHLFEEEGTLEKAAIAAADWFEHHTRLDHALQKPK